MRWYASHRYDPPAVALADRHYSRQKPGTPQFVAPGRNVVLLADAIDGRAAALWVTVWSAYAKHAWPGAWSCALFRNEGGGRLV